MLAVTRTRLEAEGLLVRTRLHVGELHSLPAGPLFNGAQMLGVLHHVAEADRAPLLRELTSPRASRTRSAHGRARSRSKIQPS